MDGFWECGNSPLSWNCESKNNPMPDYACVTDGCDIFRLLSIFKKNRIIDFLDCSKVRFSTLPFNVRIQVFSPFSKSASPLTSTSTLFLSSPFYQCFSWTFKHEADSLLLKKVFLNFRAPCSHWCVHHLSTLLSAGIFWNTDDFQSIGLVP